MANSTTPFGFKSANTLLSGGYSGQGVVFSFPTGNGTDTFVGDIVKLAGTSQIINGTVYNDVIVAASGDTFAGVIDSFIADTRDSPLYRVGGTARLAIVNIDPNAMFLVRQASGGTPLSANDIGLNANLSTATAGSTYTGQSGMALSNSTEAGTNTLDLKIMGMPSGPGNDVGTDAATGAAGSTFYVRLNRHQSG